MSLTAPSRKRAVGGHECCATVNMCQRTWRTYVSRCPTVCCQMRHGVQSYTSATKASNQKAK
eukprot:9778987-Prorocentrum_lima.AAC.1